MEIFILHDMYVVGLDIDTPAVWQQHRVPDWLHHQHSTVLQSETNIS